jgi:hypothetical protein
MAWLTRYIHSVTESAADDELPAWQGGTLPGRHRMRRTALLNYETFVIFESIVICLCIMHDCRVDVWSLQPQWLQARSTRASCSLQGGTWSLVNEGSCMIIS